MSLVAAELERQGIATVTIQLLRVAAERVRPPRALLAPYRHGFPLGRPDDPNIQHAVIEAALRMFETEDPTRPQLHEFFEEPT